MTEEKPDSIIETIKTVVYAVVLAMVIRSVAFEPFNIPSGSMLPNLLVGDYLFISKYTYGYSHFSFPMDMIPIKDRWWFDGKPGQPQQGDIVVFKTPVNPYGDAFIKRVIGLPGDRIQVIKGILTINGKPVTREEIGVFKTNGPDGMDRAAKEYLETLPNGVQHKIIEISDHEMHDNTPVFEVPEGHYFLMGDNRDNSSDSRVPEVVGYVPAENILGPARFFFFSVDEKAELAKPWDWFGYIRFSRMFRPVPD